MHKIHRRFRRPFVELYFNNPYSFAFPLGFFVKAAAFGLLAKAAAFGRRPKGSLVNQVHHHLTKIFSKKKHVEFRTCMCVVLFFLVDTQLYYQLIHQILIAHAVHIGNAFANELEGFGIIEHTQSLLVRVSSFFGKHLHYAGIFTL